MRDAEVLTSLDNPRAKAVVRLREHKERRKAGLFVAEGTREIGRALDAGLRVHELFWCPALLRGEDERGRTLEQLFPNLARSNPRLAQASEPLMRKMSYCENPEGALAVMEQPRWSLEELLAPSQASNPKAQVASPLFLIAVGTEKPGNLGAMVRSADAAGAAGVIVADGVVDAFNPNAIRASTGAVFVLPVVGGTSAEVLAALKQANVKLFAAAPAADSPYTKADLTGRVAIAIGAEDTGLDDAWLAAAKASGASGGTSGGGGVISVPMRGRAVDSLNASVTAGVLLFESLRQRMNKG